MEIHRGDEIMDKSCPKSLCVGVRGEGVCEENL